MSYIIGIAGPSGGGKTTVTKNLVDEIQDSNSVVVIQHDYYYKDQSHLDMKQREKNNYDHPNAFETSLLIEHLKDLKEGKDVIAPYYDFSKHTRDSKTIDIEAKDVIIVEGILTLENKELRDLFDLKIYVDTDTDECLMRRILRDTKDRGRTLESVLDQYRSTVKPMFLEFIEPSKKYANIIIPNGTYNQEAINIISNYMDKKINK